MTRVLILLFLVSILIWQPLVISSQFHYDNESTDLIITNLIHNDNIYPVNDNLIIISDIEIGSTIEMEFIYSGSIDQQIGQIYLITNEDVIQVQLSDTVTTTLTVLIPYLPIRIGILYIIGDGGNETVGDGFLLSDKVVQSRDIPLSLSVESNLSNLTINFNDNSLIINSPSEQVLIFSDTFYKPISETIEIFENYSPITVILINATAIQKSSYIPGYSQFTYQLSFSSIILQLDLSDTTIYTTSTLNETLSFILWPWLICFPVIIIWRSRK